MPKQQIYMNYASTSPARDPAVVAALVAYLKDNQALNAGRNFEGLADGTIAMRARQAMAALLGVRPASHLLFTSGITATLNMVLNGLVRCGDHVLSTSVEHNAVARVLELLRENGVITVDFLPCAADGSLDPALIHQYVKPNTRLLVMTHASNVLGTLLPVAQCFAAARQHGLFTVLDAAQTAGVFPVQMDENTDVIAFTGHKGLRGLAGVGGFAVTRAAAKAMRPFIVGGTGSASHQLAQPDFLPDKFEPGTQNTLGILSLAEAAEALAKTGVAAVRAHEQKLTARFLAGLSALPGVEVYGPKDETRSVAVVSLNLAGQDAGEAARRLYDEHGILTRSGLHCAPLAHQTAGTFPQGSIRFSFGAGTTEAEVDAALTALEALQQA